MKYDHNERRLERAGEMPGPGHYTKPYSDSYGKWGRSCESKYKNDPVRRFSKCKKFIDLPNFNPSPNAYAPSIEHTKYKKGAVTKIGKANVDIIDIKFGIKEALTKPGPGRYNTYTEFC